MRIAAIDIGTNTILMLVADVATDGSLVVVLDEHTIARLGQNVDRDRSIHPDAVGRATEILRGHLSIAASLGCERIVAVGTSALRDARNRDEVIRHWHRILGLDVRVIASDEEALLTYRGCLSGVDDRRTTTQAVLDIGGGSTEVTLGLGHEIIDRFSVDLGAVRLTERYWDRYPPAPERLAAAATEIRDTLRAARPTVEPAAWHAVAGTPTTLAAMALRLDRFDPSAIDGFSLSHAFVATAVGEITGRSLDELRHHPQIHPQRADIMGAGSLILLQVMDVYGLDAVRVSVRGLRFGVALEASKQQRPPT